MKKKVSLIFIAMMAACYSFAETTTGQGITYTYDVASKTASVTGSDGTSTSATILSSITVGGISYNVTSIGKNAFSGCTRLASITIPRGIVSIELKAFSRCTSLTSVNIPSTVASIADGAFRETTSLATLTVDAANADYVVDGGVLFSKDKTHLVCYPSALPATSYTVPPTVKVLNGYSFNYCSKLTTVTLPASVTSIGGASFFYCSKLTTVTLPVGITSIGDWAFGLTALTSVTIPEGITSIPYCAFYGCSALASVTLPNSLTPIWNHAFDD